MILHVTRGLRNRQFALEFVEQFTRVLAEDVHEYVEAPAMRHRNDRFDDAVRTGALNRFVQHRNQTFAAFQAESFRAGKLVLQVAFESFSGGETLEDHALHVVTVLRVTPHAFQPLLHPQLFGRIDDVHVFRADTAAVGVFQRRDDIAQRRLLCAVEERASLEDRIEVSGRQVVIRQIEDRCRGAFHHSQRINRGALVTTMTICRDQLRNADLFAFVVVGDLGGNRLRSRAETVAADQFEMANDRAVRYIGRDDTVDARQLFEVRPPFRRNVVRVLEIGFVQRLDVRDVAAREVRGLLHLFEEGFRHPYRRSFYSPTQSLAACASTGLCGDPRAWARAADQVPCCSSIDRILPIARVGLSPFGHTLTQFMMPRQRKTLNGSSSSARRSAVAVSRLSARNRYA